jgi:ATP-dependent DNA helicase PIF1
VQLIQDQVDAYNFIEKTKEPVLVTGAAGTGKSALLRFLVENGKDRDRTVVAAFTGTAALNVGGITLHELALQSKAFNKSIQVFSPLADSRELKKKNIALLSKIDLLVIDEISMVRADMIDALDRAFRLAQDSLKPFGGIRLVMFGDPFQLPPFVKERELFRRERRFLWSYEEQVNTYFHYAHVFRIAPMVSVQLYVPKRQTGQTERELQFVDVLNEIRTAKPPYSVFAWLNKEVRRANFEDEMRLYPKRKDAAEHNEIKLNELDTELHEFEAILTNSDPTRNVWAATQDYPAPYFLNVKVGATVMVVANIDISAGLVNGAVGVVTGIGEEFIEIQLSRDASIHKIERREFDRMGYVTDSEERYSDIDSDVPRVRGAIRRQIVGKYIQFPLILAWGVTIHKAQGATLDKVVVNFKESFKDPGQAYVAISRVRSIDGLGFTDNIQPSHLRSFSGRHIAFVASLDKQNALIAKKRKRNFTYEDVQKDFQNKTPWRSSDWLSQVLENYIDYLPAIKDNTDYNLRRRLVYLRDFTNVTPFEFLASQANENGLTYAVDICRNLERSIRNRLPILRAEFADSEDDEFCRDNFEMSEDVYVTRRLMHKDFQRHLESFVGQGRDHVELDKLKIMQESGLKEIFWISRQRRRQSSIQVSKSGKSWQYFDSENDEGTSTINNDSLFFTMYDHRERFEERGCSEIDFQGNISSSMALLWLRYMFSELSGIDVYISGTFVGTYEQLTVDLEQT